MPAFTPRSAVFENVQIGVETTPNTPVLATRNLSAASWSVTPAPKVDTYGPAGQKYDTNGTLISEMTNLKFDGRPDFREIIYYFSGALTTPNITTPGTAVLARQFQWLLNSASPDSQKTYSLEGGSDSVRADYLTNVLMNDLALGFDRQNPPKMSGAALAQAMVDDRVRWLKISGTPAGGTFTITVQHSGTAAQTTAAIAYNASAATVQTALIALSNIGPNDVRVTGAGVLPANPLRIELIGDLANVAQVVITANGALLTGGTSPAANVTRLSPAATQLALNTISPTGLDLFISPTSFADLDTVMAIASNGGAETDAFTYNWGITGRNEVYMPLNTIYGVGFAGTVEAKPKTTFSIDVADGDRSAVLYGYMRSQTLLYTRLRAKGALIESAGGNDYYFQLLIDTAVRLNAPSERKGVAGSVLGKTFGGTWHKDPTTGRAAIVTLITDQTAL